VRAREDFKQQERARVLQNWYKMVFILLLPFYAQFELVWQTNLGCWRGRKLLELWQILREVGVYHKSLRLHLARLERQGIFAKANSTCAPQLPPKPQKGINTILNHFCNRLARTKIFRKFGVRFSSRPYGVGSWSVGGCC
jgi:hypothetical protein